VLMNIPLMRAPAPTRQPAPARERAAAAPAQATTSTASLPRPAAKAVSNAADLIQVRAVLRAGDTASGSPDVAVTGPCARANTCPTYQLRPARWPTDKTGRAVINFAYNDDGRRSARAKAEAAGPALNAAAREWMRWNSNVVLRNVGTTTAGFGATGSDGSCADGHNVVTWSRLEPGAVGEAVICFDKTLRVVRDADLALSSTLHWETVASAPRSRHSFDLQEIYTHELGHWLSLIDLYSPESGQYQTMFGDAKYGETRKRTPALGDIIGVEKAYPCGKGDSCPRTGIVND
jgi:hypothetical protein